MEIALTLSKSLQLTGNIFLTVHDCRIWDNIWQKATVDKTVLCDCTMVMMCLVEKRVPTNTIQIVEMVNRKGRPKNSSRGTKLLCAPTSKSCSLFETPWFNRQMMLLLIPCKKFASPHNCKNDCKNEFANMVEFFGIRKA